MFEEKWEPLPLLVDDALVNFDDDRAKAALKIMAELAKKTQVMNAKGENRRECQTPPIDFLRNILYSCL